MNLKDVLSESSQLQKDKYSTIHLYDASEVVKFMEVKAKEQAR